MEDGDSATISRKKLTANWTSIKCNNPYALQTLVKSRSQTFLHVDPQINVRNFWYTLLPSPTVTNSVQGKYD